MEQRNRPISAPPGANQSFYSCIRVSSFFWPDCPGTRRDLPSLARWNEKRWWSCKVSGKVRQRENIKHGNEMFGRPAPCKPPIVHSVGSQDAAPSTPRSRQLSRRGQALTYRIWVPLVECCRSNHTMIRDNRQCLTLLHTEQGFNVCRGNKAGL